MAMTMGFVSSPFHRIFRKKRRESLPSSFTLCAAQGGAPKRFTRRELGKLFQAAAAFSAVLLNKPQEAEAMSGLKIFPLAEPLGNTYYLMRAAESISDARGIAKSNPAEMVRSTQRPLQNRK